MPVERDLHFKADKSLLDYARVAVIIGALLPDQRGRGLCPLPRRRTDPEPSVPRKEETAFVMVIPLVGSGNRRMIRSKTMTTMTFEVVGLRLGSLELHPANVRGRCWGLWLGAVARLAANIREVGLLQPLLCRRRVRGVTAFWPGGVVCRR